MVDITLVMFKWVFLLVSVFSFGQMFSSLHRQHLAFDAWGSSVGYVVLLVFRAAGSTVILVRFSPLNPKP